MNNNSESKIEKMQAAKISKVTTIKRKITSDLSKLKSSSAYYSEVEKIIESLYFNG